MLEIKLYLTPGTTIAEVRAFVKATENADAEEAVLSYDNMRDEIDGLAVVVNSLG